MFAVRGGMVVMRLAVTGCEEYSSDTQRQAKADLLPGEADNQLALS